VPTLPSGTVACVPHRAWAFRPYKNAKPCCLGALPCRRTLPAGCRSTLQLSPPCTPPLCSARKAPCVPLLQQLPHLGYCTIAAIVPIRPLQCVASLLFPRALYVVPYPATTRPLPGAAAQSCSTSRRQESCACAAMMQRPSTLSLPAAAPSALRLLLTCPRRPCARASSKLAPPLVA
jgi:hypothetical protein